MRTGKILSGGGGLHSYTFEYIISTENLLNAWQEFLRGKRNRKDVQEFERDLMKNILFLYKELQSRAYIHGGYIAFNISDPKPRSIHKASVRDRLFHHAIYRVLYPYFDKKFIHDSYSCRVGKGTHKAMNQFRQYFYKVSKNNTKTCFVLKCDIKKFFANIDHEILKNILAKHIRDKDTLWLFEQVIGSFSKGLPLGNLTSQLLVNIYMNEFDQFVKHKLKIKYFIRYADDFVILNEDKNELLTTIRYIACFLRGKLKLELHPNKIFIKTFASGVDFLGWVHFPTHRVPRTTTKKRMFRRIKDSGYVPETVQSYLGLFRYGNTYLLKEKIHKILYNNSNA